MATTADCHRALRLLFDEDRGRPTPPNARRADPRFARPHARGQALLRSVGGNLPTALGVLLEVLDPDDDDHAA